VNFIRRIKYFFRRRELERSGFKHVVADGRVWIEGPGGWRVEFGGSPLDPEILYSEGRRLVCLDAYYWHESKEDREADTSKMSARELVEHYDRRVFQIHVPENLRWSILQTDSPSESADASGVESVSADECDRILANIELAVEFGEGKKPRFVR
jgi:hypothetical protein